MKNQKLIFTVGLPCSGKSTWAKTICWKDTNHFRVSLDDIRLARGQYWIPEDESLVKEIAAMQAASALAEGKSVIYDAMNMTKKSRSETTLRIIDALETLSKEVDFKVHTKSFTDVDIRLLFSRVKKRQEEGDRRGITEKVIFDLWKRYKDELPDLIDPESRFLPKAVIVDVDGTVAKMGNRSPYDWSRVGEDKPVQSIIDLVEQFGERYEIIFVSGRSSECYDATLHWLRDNIGSVFQLHMRGRGDNRSDDVVKLEIFLNNIYKNYNVEYVLDDRNKVVDMWRNMLGLTCLQVADGDF